MLHSPTMLARFKILLISFVLLAMAIAGVYLLETREPAALEFDSSMGVSVISPPLPLPAVALQDQNSNMFRSADLEGQWNLMFFGFTHCPDICPTTLMTLKQVEKRLSPNINYVFVTLDPNRDTPGKIKEYLAFFNSDFIGLSGEKSAIDRLSATLGVIYDYEGDVESGDYLVNHYAAILVIDPKGRLRAHILPPHPVDKVVDATNRIIDYYGN